MDLTPSERAVLAQIRDLFLEASLRSYRLSILTGRWPVTHFDAYRSGFDGLVSWAVYRRPISSAPFRSGLPVVIYVTAFCSRLKASSAA